MKLTGKAKEQFEAWFRTHIPEQYNGIFTLNYEDSCYETVEFYDIPESMQWGVYQDWAYSIGYDMYVHLGAIEFCWTIYPLSDECEIVLNGFTKTRQEARNAAIEKLNQLINEK